MANPNLQKIIKLTQRQYNILSNGGTVGDYTGLNDNYLYLIQEDYEFPVTSTARKILMSTSTAGLVEWQSLQASDIPDLAASKITSGTFSTARIPSLAASKITSGTFDAARIPSLDASKITSGTFADARIASASTWNAKYTKPSGGIPASDLAESYAGSSSAGGAATSANKLNTNAGSATNPVYFTNGVPVACTYSLNKTVPADAVFTDTKYTAGTGLTLSTSNQFSVSAANASAILNLLSTGSSTPTDADYYISQYVGGGTTTTTYHRRPMSALWAYIKSKADSTYLGKTATAADSTKLNGQAASYYLNYNNFTNTPSIPTESTVSGWGFTKNAGTVTQVKVGTAAYNPSSGVVSLPAYPTKSSWDYDDRYLQLSGGTLTGNLTLTDGNVNIDVNCYDYSGDTGLRLSISQNNNTSDYFLFNINDGQSHQIALIEDIPNVPAWALAATKPSYTASEVGAATSGHTHTLSIASGGTASINLAANTTYTLTAGGKTYAFKTPPAGGSGYYSNQYNTTYYLTSNSGAGFFANDIQAGVSIVGINGGNAITLGIGWPELQPDSSKKSLMFNGNRVDLILTDDYQYYIKGFSIDMYDDDYYTLHIRANDYSDVTGSVSSENGAAVKLHASSFEYEPSYINSAVTNRKFVALGVVMHNINYTYSSTVLLKMNIRGNSASESAVTSYASLCGLLYYAGHRSAATCLTCSGRYSSSSYVVLGVYATSYNSGLYLVYCSASSNTVNTLSIASGTVTDTISVSLVP